VKLTVGFGGRPMMMVGEIDVQVFVLSQPAAV
jgi:hypothetical protein